MMTMKKRITSLLLAVGMTGSLAACSTPDADPSASPAASEEIVADLSRNILDFSAGLKADETMLTVDGEPVPADLYLYFLAVNCTYLTQNYQANVSDYADQLKDDSKTVTAYYKLLEMKCEELGCPLTDEQQTELQETLMSGGQEDYDKRKEINGLSDETMKFVYSINYFYKNVLEATIAKPTDEQLNDYVYQTRHILLKTVDTTATPTVQEDGSYAYPALDDETIAEKKALAEDLLSQLNASDDPSALFTDLMNEYSEDEGLESSPDGYTATLGQMVSPYEEAALALDIGGISGIVESEYGYHIIIRDQVEKLSDYTDEWRDYQMGLQVDKWIADADIQTTEALDNLDVADFYAKFDAYQVALSAEYTAAAATPSPSVDPSADPEASTSVEDEAVG
ncbi:peptidylprolyl isomerase [Pseudoflavonifractor capillosus]|uniref:peptidylprolyl isomerase n=1 Tax=Pseudoflavonifractor capillosus TaxID=106588 RepID=UPI00195E0702|nr:peptidylprolyl isomerase [Pseudoflavonifractor capillosus]MBM6897459.1 peptidylprolyl isomerase [Pseudoflavonifractor capillosus]